MKINASKSVIQNLVDLINASNTATNLSLTVSQVTFGNPTVRTPDADPSDTSIAVSPVTGQGLGAGDIAITYKRLALDQGFAGGASGAELQFTVAGNNGAAVTSLLAAAATQLGLVPGEFEIDAGTPLSGVSQDGVPVAIDLVPVANSKLYNAGVTIQVTWPAAADPTLDQLVVNKQQDGFEPA